MKKFEFHRRGFNHKHETIYIAIEELNYEYHLEVNGYYIYRNSKGNEYADKIPFIQNIVNPIEREAEAIIQKGKIIKEVLRRYEKTYKGTFDSEIHRPQDNTFEEINLFSPYGFKNPTYDKIIDKIKSFEIKERFRKMKNSYNEYKPGELLR